MCVRERERERERERNKQYTSGWIGEGEDHSHETCELLVSLNFTERMNES